MDALRGNASWHDSTRVVSGWPLGRVNLPMFSNFCCLSCALNPCAKLNASTRREPCYDQALRAMAPEYYFVHKIDWLEHPTRRGKLF